MTAYYRSNAHPSGGAYYRSEAYVGAAISNVTGTIGPGYQIVIDTVALGTITSVTLGGIDISANIDSTAANEVTVTIPNFIGIITGATVSLVVGDGTDTATLNNITFANRSGWLSVNYVAPGTPLDPQETESFFELMQNRYSVTLANGDQIQYQAIADLTVNADSSFLYDNTDEPTHLFAIWDASAGAFIPTLDDPNDFALPHTIEEPDSTPNVMSFNAQADATLSTQYQSNSIVIDGFNQQLTISVAGGEYNKNNNGWTSAAGVVDRGDTITLRGTSSSNYETQTNVVLTTGSVQHTFSITTAAAPADITPNPFTLNDQSGLEVGQAYASNVITVTGINGASPVSISGTGRYRKSTDGGNTWSAYTGNAGTVNNNDRVQVENTSSALFSTAISTTLTIGGVSDDFILTTRASDTTPAPFTFNDVTGAALSQLYTSNSVTITGITDPASVSVSAGAEVSINGGAFTSSPGTISNNQTLRVRITSSGANSTAVNAVVTVGGVSDTYTVTTEALNDENPAQFTFNSVVDADTDTLYTSTAVTITEINVAAPISVTGPGAQYSIDGGAWTSTPGTVSNGQQVRVRVQSSLLANTLVAATLLIGNVSDSFEVTTADVLLDGGINESIDVLVFTYPAANDGKRNVIYRNNTNQLVMREIIYEYTQEAVDIDSIAFQLQDVNNNVLFGPVNVVLDGHYRVSIPHTLDLSAHDQVIAVIDIDSSDNSQAYLSIVHDVEDRGE